MPGLKLQLEQAGIDLTPRDYLAIAMFSGILVALILFPVMFALSLLAEPIMESSVIAIMAAVVGYVAIFAYSLNYPRTIVHKKIKLLERDLLFALKYILIRIKSGVSLYDAMVGIANGKFGQVSVEFKKAISEIATGTKEVEALENMAVRVPSTFFRRTLWQITNNLRAGSDIAQILEAITSTLVREERILIRRYGSELNPIIMMYMMFCIIIPSLGVTVMIVMSSLSGLAVPIFVFYLVPVAVFIMNVIFTRIIKDKKPMISLGGE
jgi:pilus assembly protein TadC